MKEINYIQNTPQGVANGTLRIHGKLLFFKVCNNNIQPMIEKLRSAGAEIKEGSGWIMVDIIRDNETVILDREKEIVIDTKEMTDEEIEKTLLEFYTRKYKEARFIVTVKEVF